MGTGIGGISSFASCFSHQVLYRQKASLLDTMVSLDGTEGVDSLRESLDRMPCPNRFHPFGVAMTMPNACSGNIGIKFNLSGNNNTFCSACASGTVAIGYGFKAVKAGEVDLALVGGSEYLYDQYGGMFAGFDAVRALANGDGDPDKANRPFDKDRSGFLFSEGGGAVLVIEDLEHAIRRGAPIFSEIVGYAETCDANNIMMMEKSGRNIKRMIENALADSKMSAEDVDYINAHGTGTVLNDETEARVIENIFGRKVLVNSTKSLVGHTLGASGAIEAVVTVLSICNKTTHINKNLTNPIADLAFITQVDSYPIKTAISQSFGFGGHNAVLVFREFEKE
jgi:3-oxoacyl-[acyl-carrier-protein] synthase II